MGEGIRTPSCPCTAPARSLPEPGCRRPDPLSAGAVASKRARLEHVGKVRWVPVTMPHHCVCTTAWDPCARHTGIAFAGATAEVLEKLGFWPKRCACGHTMSPSTALHCTALKCSAQVAAMHRF